MEITPRRIAIRDQEDSLYALYFTEINDGEAHFEIRPYPTIPYESPYVGCSWTMTADQVGNAMEELTERTSFSERLSTGTKVFFSAGKATVYGDDNRKHHLRTDELGEDDRTLVDRCREQSRGYALEGCLRRPDGQIDGVTSFSVVHDASATFNDVANLFTQICDALEAS